MARDAFDMKQDKTLRFKKSRKGAHSMIVQMFVINCVEQRVFQHIEKIRNLKHKNTVGFKHVTYTGDDAAKDYRYGRKHCWP